MAEPTFPVDDVTLAMLAQSCEIGDDGRSHLFDVLDFGAQESEREQLGENTFLITYEEGRAPWQVHQVIPALVAEIMRLRDGAPQPEANDRG